tara:strand:- start:422 stop:1408 length:987 start_codon:yes stop_codon:yes gene_type:complete
MVNDKDFAFAGLLPDVVINAIESLGIYPSSGLLPLNSYENRVYQFRCDEGMRYVAKFYRPYRWSNAQIEEEHLFSQQLLDDEVPVVAPLKVSGQSLHEYEGYRFAVFPSIGGRAFEPNDLDDLERLGRQIGRLHQVGKKDAFKARESLDIQRLLSESIDELRQSQLLPRELEAAFWAILSPLAETLQTFAWDSLTYQRLHGDCHIGNVLQYDTELTFVDLDDCRMGPAIQDLWMMLNGSREDQTCQLDALVEGYQDFCNFDKKEIAFIEPLRGFRLIHYMAWLSKRWQDSAFQRAFPWFSEARYWESQILALKEQRAALDETPIKLGY